ncbi:hypothetical protein GMORB2_0186 [Geosmithia morbida]|uniref:Myb-like DNA-binding domain-containing protein n=1 Tax=Geosmithia morbida TaxID=1094350 RepID=A0A9P4Z0S2_9HYPO|nr:uncharacterized protein GMORB2_0186 [Geosmithia morbida]KAF4126450.1 hypothetical protein GMORB2_0186 [Geosmithia morbida]
MSPNNGENATARFLFAILKQKNLKDIDWNQVAQDPVLMQPISNGHAARMRYFRFRATVEGHEGRVAKTRAGDTANKSRASRAKARKVSSESVPESNTHSSGAVRIKKEFDYPTRTYPMSNCSPASISVSAGASPYLSDCHDDFGTGRFPTPCSDDMTNHIHTQRQTVIDPAVTIEGGGNIPHNAALFTPLFLDPGHPNNGSDNMHSPAFSSAFDDASIDMVHFGSDAARVSPDITAPYMMGSNDWDQSLQHQF